MLLQHFGQTLAEPCGACDICLGTLQQVSDPLIIGQKILSCVLRVSERFGADHVAKVLIGSREQRICDLRHDRLSTWGLLSDYRKGDVRDWIEQLVQQGFLSRGGEYQVLSVSPPGRSLLKGATTPKLLRAATAPIDQLAILECRLLGRGRSWIVRGVAAIAAGEGGSGQCSQLSRLQ